MLKLDGFGKILLIPIRPRWEQASVEQEKQYKSVSIKCDLSKIESVQNTIFEILNERNFWFRPPPETFERASYSDQIAQKAASGEIIVIKGVRCSGKSILLINEIKRLMGEGIDPKNILFVNFEDQRFRIFDDQTLLEDIKNVYLEYLQSEGDLVIMLVRLRYDRDLGLWQQGGSVFTAQ